MKRLRIACVAALIAASVSVACKKERATEAPTQNEAAGAGGERGTIMVWPDEGFRYQAPKPGPTPKVTVPEPTLFKLDCGVTVYLVPRKTIPTVSLSLVFPTGSVIDPKGQRGLASACMDLLEQGTQSLDKPAFEARKADLAAGVSAWANAETSGVAMSSLHRNFGEAADLMLEMLERPGLRERDLQRLISRRKSNLEQNKAAPGALGGRLWRSILWGPEHPYGQLTTKAQYEAITVEGCRGWLNKIGTRGASMFVAGATTEAEIRTIFDARLGAWANDRSGRPRASVTSTPPPPAPRKGTLFFVDVPGAAQSQIYVGHPGPRRDAADYEATMLMAQVLGGGFSSRINMNIREDKGYAYGARARFSYRRSGGTFAASSSVRSDATAAAVTEMVSEIRTLRAEGVKPDELAREREGTLLALPARFSTASRVRSTYSNLVFFGLPLDYYDGFQKRVAAADESDLKRAADKYLRDGAYEILIVGDGATIRDSLRALVADGTLGEEGFVELDADGNVLSPGV